MLATGVLGSGSPRKSVGAGVSGSSAQSQTPPPFIGRSSTPSTSTTSSSSSSSIPSSLGIPFDPYDHTPLPARIISTGAAANFPSVSNLVGDVFNAPVFVPNTQVDSAQVVPHRNAPAQGFPGRAALGGAYVARWVWGREWGAGGLGVYEDEIRRLLQKRWIATGGTPLRTNVGGVSAGMSGAGAGAGSAGLLGLVSGAAGVVAGANAGASGSGANSGSSTPFGSRSGVGATVFEEDEDELERVPGSAGGNGTFGLGIPGLGVPHDPAIMAMGAHVSPGFVDASSRMRTQTGSTVDTLSSSTSSIKASGSTAYTTPDIASLSMAGLNISPGPGSGAASNGQTTPGGSGVQQGQGQGQGQTNPTPLTPVVALPTSDAEAQIGLAKVAEPDADAFLTYAAIVPEYCRLEGLLVKGIV